MTKIAKQYLIHVEGKPYYTEWFASHPEGGEGEDGAMYAAAVRYPERFCAVMRDQRGKLVTRLV